MTLGSRLQMYAKARWETQRALAKAIDVRDSQMSDWIKDRMPPSTDSLDKLARAGLNVHWLLTGEGEMDAPEHGQRRPIEDRLQDIVDELRRTRPAPDPFETGDFETPEIDTITPTLPPTTAEGDVELEPGDRGTRGHARRR